MNCDKMKMLGQEGEIRLSHSTSHPIHVANWTVDRQCVYKEVLQILSPIQGSNSNAI